MLNNLSGVFEHLSVSLCSALDVNILYGSNVSFVIRSSIITPIYDESRVRTIGSLSNTFKDAFIPQTKPWAAASS